VALLTGHEAMFHIWYVGRLS